MKNGIDVGGLYLADKVLREVGKVIGLRNIFVGEQVLCWILGLVTISKEELEEVEKSQEIYFANCTLNTI